MIAFYDKILRQIEKQQGDVFTKREVEQDSEDVLAAPSTYATVSCLRSSTPFGPAWPAWVCCPAFESLHIGDAHRPTSSKQQPKVA